MNDNSPLNGIDIGKTADTLGWSNGSPANPPLRDTANEALRPLGTADLKRLIDDPPSSSKTSMLKIGQPEPEGESAGEPSQLPRADQDSHSRLGK